jgi:Na+/H+ antiporter NhaD/arsenite permease-like protein
MNATLQVQFKQSRLFAIVLAVLAVMFVFAMSPTGVHAQGDETLLILLGRVQNLHQEPVYEAVIHLLVDGEPVLLWQGTESHEYAMSQPDGSFSAEARLSQTVADALASGRVSLTVQVTKPTFHDATVAAEVELSSDTNHLYVDIPSIVLDYQYGAAFWVATLAFVLVLVLIATGRLHKTIAALLGAVIVMGASGLGAAFYTPLHIFSVDRAFHYVDLNVILLILGMMAYVGMAERTGVFQRLAYLSYRAARGKVWLLALYLMTITAVASAFLDNVTTMLLMSPISIEIALVLGVNPLALLIPEVLASNIGGTATLIGDPPNILIGSYTGKSFLEFVAALGPVVLISLLVLAAFVMFRYRHEYRPGTGLYSKALLERLESDSRIRDPLLLRRVAVVGGLMGILFVLGETLHLRPSVVALGGAVLLMVWNRPNVEELLHDVDWTTLIFFLALFIVVGAIEEVGLIQAVADLARRLAGGNLTIATMLVLWLSALASGIVDNIPFTAAMLPVAGYLTRMLPGAENEVIFWALSVGACFGGNLTLVGASANLVTAGISERAGYPVTYMDFLKVGAPLTLLTILLASAYFLIAY